MCLSRMAADPLPRNEAGQKQGRTERLRPAWWRDYVALRKEGLSKTRAFLAATAWGFDRSLLRKRRPEQHAALLGEHIHAALARFGKVPRLYLLKAAPDAKEFFHFLCARGMNPAKAWYEARIKQASSAYYDEEGVREFALDSWASHVAAKTAEILFHRSFNRESGKGAQELQQKLKEIFKAKAVRGGLPFLRLNVFWGGHKEAGDYSAEAKALEKLSEVRRKLRDIGVYLDVRLLFGDVHSKWVNGVSQEKIGAYEEKMRGLAQRHDFDFLKLSELYASHFPLAGPLTVRRDGKVMIPLAPTSTERLVSLAQEVGGSIEKVIRQYAFVLPDQTAAERHSQLVAVGEQTPLQATAAYNILRRIEAKLLERTLGREELYAAYADPRQGRGLHPSNTLFIWSEKRGVSRTPWFGERS